MTMTGIVGSTPGYSEQIETFLPGGRVARIVQVHDQRVEIAGLQRVDDGGGRGDRSIW